MPDVFVSGAIIGGVGDGMTGDGNGFTVGEEGSRSEGVTGGGI